MDHRPVELHAASVKFISQFLRDPASAEFDPPSPVMMYDEGNDLLSYHGAFKAPNAYRAWERVTYGLTFDVSGKSMTTVDGIVGDRLLVIDRRLRIAQRRLSDSLGTEVAKLEPYSEEALFLTDWQMDAWSKGRMLVDAPLTSPFIVLPYLE